jgi:NAD(P)H-dependent flavin oxidoreductase YrpB (nitropropane dioxygenase family)
VHATLKQALRQASERDTNLIFRTMNNTARVLKNAISDEVVAMERRPGGCRFEDVRHLVAGARGRESWEGGDVNGGVLTAGMVVGLIDDIPTCAELIERMTRDCREHLTRALSWMSA